MAQLGLWLCKTWRICHLTKHNHLVAPWTIGCSAAILPGMTTNAFLFPYEGNKCNEDNIFQRKQQRRLFTCGARSRNDSKTPAIWETVKWIDMCIVKCSISTPSSFKFHEKWGVPTKTVTKTVQCYRRHKSWLCSRKSWIMKRLQLWYWQFLFSLQEKKRKEKKAPLSQFALHESFIPGSVFLAVALETIPFNFSPTPISYNNNIYSSH